MASIFKLETNLPCSQECKLLKLLTIFAESSILDVWQGSAYVSIVLYITELSIQAYRLQLMLLMFFYQCHSLS